MKKVLTIILAVVLVLSVSGCGKKDESNTTTTKGNNNGTTTTKKKETYAADDKCTKDGDISKLSLVNCNNCVFAYFTDKKSFGSVVSEYTKDVTTLKDKHGCQRRRFLGFILDSSNKIQHAYTCGIKNNKVFCVEGSADAYQTNANILQSVYSSSECRFIANGKTITCTDGHLNADARADGQVSVHYDENCHIWPDSNTISCYANW